MRRHSGIACRYDTAIAPAPVRAHAWAIQGELSHRLAVVVQHAAAERPLDHSTTRPLVHRAPEIKILKRRGWPDRPDALAIYPTIDILVNTCAHMSSAVYSPRRTRINMFEVNVRSGVRLTRTHMKGRLARSHGGDNIYLRRSGGDADGALHYQ
nr:hypothetical protein [uncultured Duganella sp.]